jgi:uncharacterized membrane protein
VAYYLKLYMATLAVFLLLDGIWLGLLARSFYRKHLGPWMAPSPNWAAAVAFYLLFVAGMVVFVVLASLDADSVTTTLLRAAFFGLVAYATYDLTNLAVMKDWPVIVTVVDLIWGTTLSTVVGWAGWTAAKWLR